MLCARVIFTTVWMSLILVSAGSFFMLSHERQNTAENCSVHEALYGDENSCKPFEPQLSNEFWQKWKQMYYYQVRIIKVIFKVNNYIIIFSQWFIINLNLLWIIDVIRFIFYFLLIARTFCTSCLFLNLLISYYITSLNIITALIFKFFL